MTRPTLSLRRFPAALALSLCMALGAPSLSAAEESPAAVPPMIVTIKMERVLAESAAGKEVARQMEALVERMTAEFKPRSAELKVEEQAIAAVKSQIDEAEFQRRVQAFERRTRQYEEELKLYNQRLGAARAAALEEIRRQLAPVLQEIMIRRQAGIMLDETRIILAASELDVTEEAIRAFDATLKPIVVRLPDELPPY